MAENNASRPTYRITDLHDDDRPRERLQNLGPQALSNAELIAILLRVGVQGENAVQVGQRLLQKFGGIAGIHRAPFDELLHQHGIGEAKAAQIKAAIELGRRLTLESPEERPVINSPADAAVLVQYEMQALEQEHLRVMLLDRRNRVLEIVDLYRGSVSSSQIRVGEVFREAVRKNASAIIVMHNHPSGEIFPSPVIWRKSQGYWRNSVSGNQALVPGSLHAGDYLPSGHPVKGASLRSASLRDFALDRGPTCGKVFRLGSDSFKKTWIMLN